MNNTSMSWKFQLSLKSFVRSATKVFILWLSLPAMLLAADNNSGGLTTEQTQAIYKAHAEAVEKCKAKWQGKQHVHIRGSHYELDPSKLPWRMDYSEVWSDDEDCGAAAINGIFFWTGKEIVPKETGLESQPTRINLKDVQKDWVRIDVTALVGAPADMFRRCQQHPEDCRFAEHPPMQWPPEQFIRLKQYPDLEVLAPKAFIPESKGKGVTFLVIYMRSWKKENDLPRSFVCYLKQHVYEMTRDEIEKVNLGKHNEMGHSFCQMERDDFRFNSGSARLTWGSEDLHQITPALRALQQYLNASITKEKP